MALNHEVGDGIDASDHRHFHDAIWRCLVPQPLLRSVVVTGRGREGGVTANLVRARLDASLRWNVASCHGAHACGACRSHQPYLVSQRPGLRPKPMMHG
jgi:hypothetical protein